MNARTIIFAFAILFLTISIPSLVMGQSPAPLATVSVQAVPPGREIPRDFVGFSLEVSSGGQGLSAFKSKGSGEQAKAPTEIGEYVLGRPDAPNAGFFQFMRDLGPGILRLGGNSQDNTCWDPRQAPHPDACKATLTAADLKLFSDAARASGWRLILGINLKQDSASWALKEITEGVAREIQPKSILGLEIGNEPDLFRRTALRAKGYSPADHAKEFLDYAHAFAKNPEAKRYAVVGPATCCSWRNAADLGAFIDGVGPKTLKLVTVHNYSATTCGGRTVSIGQLLAPSLMDRLNREVQPLVAAATSRGLPIAMAETNSASCGGMPGVSNSFASALWGLDYMFTLAQDGFRSVNFHMSYRPGGGSSYNPIDTYAASSGGQYRNVAEPLYYAMYLFARNASGERLTPTSISTNANITAYATSAPGSLRVYVINKDLKAAGEIEVKLSRATGPASLLLLKASSLDSAAQQTSYGNAQFRSNGVLPAPRLTKVSGNSRGEYRFYLPNASAAVLTVKSAHGGA